MKVVYLTNTPAPYRLSFYERWAELDDLLVVFDRDNGRAEWIIDTSNTGFRFTCLNSRSMERVQNQTDLQFTQDQTVYFSTGVLRVLAKEKPEVVVSTELGPRTLMASLYCKSTGVPLIIQNEGTPHTERSIGPVRRLLRKYLVSQATSFWANGSDSEEYLAACGAPRERIQTGMTGVDTAFFTRRARERLSGREAFRATLGIQGTAILILGKLSRLKGIPQLRNAVSRLLERHPGLEFSLIFLGNGEELSETQAWADSLPKGVKCIFPGFVQIDGVPDYLAAADWGLMPTLQDCWPLATLEMLLAGLPQLFSVLNGGTAELYRGGVTGLSFDPLDTDGFAGALETVLAQPGTRLSDQVVDSFASFYSPEAQAQRAHTIVRETGNR